MSEMSLAPGPGQLLGVAFLTMCVRPRFLCHPGSFVGFCDCAATSGSSCRGAAAPQRAPVTAWLRTRIGCCCLAASTKPPPRAAGEKRL